MVSSYRYADGWCEPSVMAIDEPISASLRMRKSGWPRLDPAGGVSGPGAVAGSSPDLLFEEGDRRYLEILSDLVVRSGLCMAGVDRQFRITVANRSFCWQLGRPPAGLAGLQVGEVLDGGTSAYLYQRLDELFSGRRSRFTASVVARRPDGSAVSGDVTGVLVQRADTEASEVLVIFLPSTGNRSAGVVIEPGEKLSELDATILQSVATGIPSAHLAKELYLSRQGVDYHISQLLRRFRVPNRPALVARAYAAGFLTRATWPPQVIADKVQRPSLGGSAVTDC